MLNVRLFKSYGQGTAFTLGYILILYATLPLTPDLIKWVKGTGAFQAFVFGPFAFSVTVLGYVGVKTETYKNRSFWVSLLALGLMFNLIFKNVIAPVELLHLMLYGIMCILLYSLLSFRFSGATLYILSAFTTSLFGAIDEVIQYYLPNRVFDWNDIVFNILGGVMALVIVRFVFGDKGE